MDDYYKHADIFVLPSYNEGLPMSILEAGSFGLPVISTPVGGIPEVIEDGVNGYLIEPGDIEALKDRLLLLANGPELREKMGKNLKILIGEKFNEKKMVNQINFIYQELLEV